MKAYEETDALRPTQVEGVPLAHLVKALELHELAPVGDLKVTGVSVAQVILPRVSLCGYCRPAFARGPLRCRRRLSRGCGCAYRRRRAAIP